MLELSEVRNLRDGFDSLLPEDSRVFCFCEDDGRFDELMLMVYQAVPVTN